jgi:hypothetical protein
MDKITIMGKLGIGFTVAGKKFQPQAFILMVDEPDFGCEGRPEGAPVYAEIYGYDKTGERKWLLEERYLASSCFDDKMWLGTLQGVEGTVAVSDKDGSWQVIADGPWLDIFK